METDKPKSKLTLKREKLDKVFSVWSENFQAEDLVAFCFSLSLFGIIGAFL